ncbi:hypothetical protein NXW35_07255 [Parabacteroides distasonis]|uniref:hypothetical protein n=1 Tax=Parabacteroides distasonis TaxID=823 RepID=UPI0021612EF3|nr:hypothetical protein [Parabacteroides distasonis]UVQ81049.1 hypothetical protein NXW35_07255 [Parabacteroides distasonis]
MFWTGWLDSELYNEVLSKSSPYEVEFSASDFNITERLKYINDSDAKYSDIVPVMTHIKRCLDKLKLPFGKIYIGCTTTIEGISLNSSETALHKSYVTSSNFYDEDGKPMSCREVLDNCLRPFALMMVQKDGNVYVYDYNTIKKGLPMKRFDFSSMTYEDEEFVDFYYGNALDIGIMSSDGDYGFEEMFNNVTITSSLYAAKDGVFSYDVEEDNLADLISTSDNAGYVLKKYGSCPPWKEGRFLRYENKRNTGADALIGAEMIYTGDSSAINQWSFDGKNVFIIGNTDAKNYLRIKAQAYVNTRDDPFDTDIVEDDERTGVMGIYGDLVLYDSMGTPVMYYDNSYRFDEGWKDVTGSDVPLGKFILTYVSLSETASASTSRIANQWLTNGQNMSLGESLSSSRDQAGNRLIAPPVSGYLVMRMRYCVIKRLVLDKEEIFPADRVKNILIDHVSMNFENDKGDSLNTDDYEFKSYINKKVASDFEEITLKCISANEDNVPTSKASILKKDGNNYKFQLSFTRSNQTDILERLLMCTVHSNFSQKNERFSVDVKLIGNPALSYLRYSPVLSGEYLVTGCDLDFRLSIAKLSAVGYSDDTAKLSDIPYD